MADDHVRIRLKDGNAEIELEGSRSDVDALLEKWWSTTHPTGDSEGRAKPRKMPTVAAKHVRSAHPQSDESESVNVHEIVNRIKESDELETLETKVFHKADRYNKVAAVLSLADTDLTTGEIAEVLTQLGVKIDQSSVSHLIKHYPKDFIQSEPRKAGARVRYRLTAKAATDFSNWLSSAQ